MEYFFSIKDKYNYFHSIDNCILSYYLKCSCETAISILRMSGSNRSDYWEKLNVGRCVKYNFFQNHIHYDEGIYLKIGHYQLYDKEKKIYRVLPILQLEVNPNKHYKKDSFQEILDFLDWQCCDGTLVKYDYAIDFNLPLQSIQVFNSRKEKGLYKGTRYFGQRNRNGYLKIYDKGREQNIDKITTRVEHTIVNGDRLSLEELFILDNSVKPSCDGFSKSLKALIDCVYRLKANNIDYSDILDSLPKTTKWRINEVLNGGYSRYEYDSTIIKELLVHICELFKIEYSFENGFISAYDVPFE